MRFTTKLLTALAISVLLLVSLSSLASARHGGGGGSPPAPVEVDSICKERSPDGGGFGWFAVGPGFGGCNRVANSITFDGVTPYSACLGGAADQVLYFPGLAGCAPFDQPVTLTGDGSVSVCLSAYDRVEAPWSSGCVTAAVI